MKTARSVAEYLAKELINDVTAHAMSPEAAASALLRAAVMLIDEADKLDPPKRKRKKGKKP